MLIGIEKAWVLLVAECVDSGGIDTSTSSAVARKKEVDFKCKLTSRWFASSFFGGTDLDLDHFRV